MRQAGGRRDSLGCRRLVPSSDQREQGFQSPPEGHFLPSAHLLLPSQILLTLPLGDNLELFLTVSHISLFWF